MFTLGSYSSRLVFLTCRGNKYISNASGKSMSNAWFKRKVFFWSCEKKNIKKTNPDFTKVVSQATETCLDCILLPAFPKTQLK